MNEQSSVTSAATTLEMFTHWKIIKFRMSFAIVDITTCTCSTDSPSQEKDPTAFICCYYVASLKKWSSGELVWKCINFDVPSTRPAKKKKRNPAGVEMLGRLNVPQLKKAKLIAKKFIVTHIIITLSGIRHHENKGHACNLISICCDNTTSTLESEPFTSTVNWCVGCD